MGSIRTNKHTDRKCRYRGGEGGWYFHVTPCRPPSICC